MARGYADDEPLDRLRAEERDVDRIVSSAETWELPPPPSDGLPPGADHVPEAIDYPFCDAIIPGMLYLGDHQAAHWIRDEAPAIRDVVNVTPEGVVENVWEGAGGYRYLRIPIRDRNDEDLSPHLDAACAFIDDALAGRRQVLVHCQAGISRSPAVVAAYLMHRHGFSVDDAVDVVRACRSDAMPRRRFREQLEEWMKAKRSRAH
jgi:dual specificity phosphatase 12